MSKETSASVGTGPNIAMSADAAFDPPVPLRRRVPFLRMFSTAVINQAMLSAASLLAGLVLVRFTADLQYGYYVLVTNALMLMTGIQGSFIGPSMVNRMAHTDKQGRADLVGGLFREQNQFLRPVIALIGVAGAVLWLAGVLDRHIGPLLIVTAVTSMASLNREFFRSVLLAHRRPEEVLRADMIYVALMALSLGIAVFTPFPAVFAVLGLGVAARGGTWRLRRALSRFEPWNINGHPGILREIAPSGFWSTTGTVVHWAFNQGYSYLVAAVLGVPAVAAIAATRLMMMPVNLLSTGMGSIMLPFSARWLKDFGPAAVLRRLSLFTLGLAGAALVYFGTMWLLRDWIYHDLLHKNFADRDLLLKLWVAVFLVIVLRDQMIWLLVARQRFRPLAGLTAISAMVALTVSYFAMQSLGVSGALVGIIAGESLQVCGIIAMSLYEIRR